MEKIVKRIMFVVALMMFMTPAFAENTKVGDAMPTHPACGATAEECQAKLDQSQAQAANFNKQVQIYRQLLGEANDRLAQQAASH